MIKTRHWNMMETSSYWLTRLFLQRGIAFIYVIAFLIALNQGPGLIGPRGILPAEEYVPYLNFWSSECLSPEGVWPGFDIGK